MTGKVRPPIMQVTLQRLSPVLVEFDVQVAADRVKNELDRAYSEVARSARVPGFRPGKAPRRVLAHYYGARIQADVAQKLVDETFPKAVEDHQLQPVNRPAIETQKLSESTDFTYKARVEVLPKIESVEYEGLEAKRPKVAVADAEIDQEIDRLRRAHATLQAPSEARPTKAGDLLTLDLEVEVDGKRVSELAAQDLNLEIGSQQVLPELSTGLEGHSQGETVPVQIQMPAQHPSPQLRDKLATFHATIKEVKERVLPEVDDEFAKDVGDFESLAALREDIRQRLEKQSKETSDNQLAERLVVALVGKNPIPVPPSLVEQQMRITSQEILARARAYGQEANEVGAELRQQIQTDSEVKVRAGLLMAEIAKKEQIQIDNEAIEKGIQELAEQTGKNPAKLRVEYREPKKREMLIGMLLENKVLDIIEAKAKIEDE
ncbi:MAG TPA: trigger factor [Polyangiaceae bacterium]|nr:trigger factor [Polyangiaceae bacterium]